MSHLDDQGMTTKQLFDEFFPNRPDVVRLLMEPITYANGSTLEDPALTYGIVFSNFMSKGVFTFEGGTDLLIELRSSFKDPGMSEEVILAPLRDVDVLLVDDLGAMKISDWTMDILNHVINNRYKSGKLLLVTTNFMDRDVGVKSQTLEERIGTPLRSRLYEMCKLVEIDGGDFRKNQKKDMPLMRDPVFDE